MLVHVSHLLYHWATKHKSLLTDKTAARPAIMKSFFLVLASRIIQTNAT